MLKPALEGREVGVDLLDRNPEVLVLASQRPVFSDAPGAQ
jgi:hypothetical protein